MKSQPSAAHLEGVFKQMTGRVEKQEKNKPCRPHKQFSFLLGRGKRVMNYLRRTKGMGIGTEVGMGLHHILIIN